MILRYTLSALLLLSFVAPSASGAQSPPGTDIWAFRISGATPPVGVGAAVRVTNRPGYDNQPHFPPGERLILYTAINSVGQADIWSYDLRSGERKNVTQSAPESEYSATVMPSLGRFSAIRVEADSTQRLWSFESGGTNPEVLLEGIEPVGYHAWFNEDLVALFVLGNPATLQVASVSRGTSEIVAENIGRSLHRVPGRETVSFVQLDPIGPGWIMEFDPRSGIIAPLAPLLEGNEFYAWAPDRVILTGEGSTIYRWVPGESDSWEAIIDLGPAGILGISRIAVSPEGGWIAIVARDT